MDGDELIECCSSLNSTWSWTYSRCPCILKWREAGPVWWDVEPTVLHLFPLMGSASPLQVCISLIKKCLCASCLPSARFIIKVSWWENKRFGGNSGWPSRFTNLWSSFHEHGGPRCSSCGTHGYLFAKGAYMVKPTWLAAPCPCAPPCNLLYIPQTAHLLFFGLSCRLTAIQSL